MKKIESAKEREKRERKKQQILSGVIIFVLLLSIAGYATFSNINENKREIRNYNGFELYEDNGLWKTELNGEEFKFYNLPTDLVFSTEINVTLADIQGEPIYFVGSYPSTIIDNLRVIVLRMQGACIENWICLNENYPIKNCSEDNILIFAESEESKIYQEENCIYLEGNLNEVSDKFIYKLLGIEV